MISIEQRRSIIDCLGDHLGYTGDVGGFIQFAFPQASLRQALGPLPLTLITNPDRAAWVVNSVAATKWNFDPSLLELLLKGLTLTGAYPELLPILDQVRARKDPTNGFFHSQWVVQRQPFFDRVELRTKARTLVDLPFQPILRVNGGRGSGKSYTKELLEHVMTTARPDLHVVPVFLAPGAGPTYEVSELADQMTLSMKSLAPMPSRNGGSAYAPALFRWVVRGVNDNPGVWIFVLDGFGQPDLQKEVVEFIQLLTQHLLSMEFAKRMRLVLLHFEGPVHNSANWRPKTIDDGPLPKDFITRAEVVSCLQERNEALVRADELEKVVPNEVIDLVADTMLRASASPDACVQLKSLNEQFAKLEELRGFLTRADLIARLEQRNEALRARGGAMDQMIEPAEIPLVADKMLADCAALAPLARLKYLATLLADLDQLPP